MIGHIEGVKIIKSKSFHLTTNYHFLNKILNYYNTKQNEVKEIKKNLIVIGTNDN